MSDLYIFEPQVFSSKVEKRNVEWTITVACIEYSKSVYFFTTCTLLKFRNG